MRLARLSRAEVHRLAVALGAPDPTTWTMLDERADGLPFLVEELVALRGSGAVPPTLRALVADRLALITPEQRRVLAGAAVLGLVPDWTLLHHVTDISEPDVLAALRAAEEARLLTIDAGTLRWRHALTHEAVLARVLPPERAMLSRRAAETLLARGRPDDDAAAAELLLRAGVDHTAADLLLTLVRRYLAAGAFRTAERLLDELADIPSHRAAAAAERVRLLCLQGRAREALAVAAPVLDGATATEHVELALTLARAAVLTGRWDTVRDLVARAGRPDDPRSETLLADAAHGAGLLDEAMAHALGAVACAERDGDPGQLCDALAVLAKVQRLADPGTARNLFDRAAQVAAEHGLVDARVEALIGRTTLEMLETEDASGLEVARRLAQQAGLVGQVISIDLLHSDSVLVHDGPAAAAPLAQDLLERGTALEMPMPRLAGVSMLALAAAAAGDRLETERQLAPFEIAQGPREASMIPAAVRAMLAVATHDLRTANAVLDPAVAPVVDAPLHGSTAPLRPVGVAADRDRRPRRRSPAGALRGTDLTSARQRHCTAVCRCGRRWTSRPSRRRSRGVARGGGARRGDAVAAPSAEDCRPRQRRGGRLG